MPARPVVGERPDPVVLAHPPRARRGHLHGRRRHEERRVGLEAGGKRRQVFARDPHVGVDERHRIAHDGVAPEVERGDLRRRSGLHHAHAGVDGERS